MHDPWLKKLKVLASVVCSYKSLFIIFVREIQEIHYSAMTGRQFVASRKQIFLNASQDEKRVIN